MMLSSYVALVLLLLCAMRCSSCMKLIEYAHVTVIYLVRSTVQIKYHNIKIYRFQWLQKVRISLTLKEILILTLESVLFVACNLVSVKYGDKNARVEVWGIWNVRSGYV